MKKNQNILKFVKKGFLVNLLLTYSLTSFAAIDTNDEREIRQLFRSEMSNLLSKYKSTQPLTSDLLNAGDATVLGFLKSTTKYREGHGLATNYFPTFKVSGVETSFCLVFYEPKKNIFNQYIKETSFTEEEALKYLIWHEMGHCFAFHEKFTKTPKADETIADMFAISLSINKKINIMPQKIISSLKNIKENDIHANSTYLEKFFVDSNNSNLFEKELTINQLLELVFYYFNNDNFENFSLSRN